MGHKEESKSGWVSTKMRSESELRAFKKTGYEPPPLTYLPFNPTVGVIFSGGIPCILRNMPLDCSSKVWCMYVCGVLGKNCTKRSRPSAGGRETDELCHKIIIPDLPFSLRDQVPG